MVSDMWQYATDFFMVLRRHVRIHERVWTGHLQSICDTLEYTLPVDSSPNDQRRVRVALELLHTLWTLNRDAWRQAMLACVDDYVPNSVVLPIEKEPALTIVISVKYDKFPGQLNSARWETLLDPTIRLTEAEATAKETLIQAYGQEAQSPIAPAGGIPLRLQFLVFGMATKIVPMYMAKVVDMVEAVQGHVGGKEPTRSMDACVPFKLTSLVLNVSQYEMTNRMAREIIRLHGLGIPFHNLHIRIIQHDPDSTQQEDTTDRDRLFTVLFDGSSPVDETRFTLETLTIDRADLVQFHNACTALETTHTVISLWLQNVLIFDSPTDRALKWEYLMRALSRGSIKSVSIDQDDFELADAAAVVNALQTLDGLALEKLDIGTQASFPETIETIPLLLQQLGRNLTSLSITTWVASLSATSIVNIQRACPHLLYLDLYSIELDSMDVFLELYEHHNCQVHALGLHAVEVPNEAVTAFALALCDPTRRVFRVLRELCLDAIGENNTSTYENMDAFYTLLTAPGSPLEYLDLRIHKLLLVENEERFLAHHNTWGSGIAESFPIHSKIAFLSVCRLRFDGRNDKGDSNYRHLLNQLDENILSLIFQFAATCVRKRVCLVES